MATRAQKKDTEQLPPRALPRGPHGLSRAEVERSQRERLMAAMAECVAEKGFAATAVADVLARAGVSRATFYIFFKDKDDCFQASFQAAAQHIGKVMMMNIAALSAGSSESGIPLTPLEKVEAMLTFYLDALTSNPALAHTFLVDVYAAGPLAVKQRLAAQKIFADILCETHHGEEGLLGTKPEQRFAAEAIVNAVSAMMTNLVALGDFKKIRKLKEPMMKLITDLSTNYVPTTSRGARRES